MFNSIPILMYHGFLSKEPDSKIVNYDSKHISIELFEKQLEFLSKNHTVISLEESVNILKDKKCLPKKNIVLTIDDGYRSNYLLAFPILSKFGFKATIFVTTDFIDQLNYLWFDRLEHAINVTDKNNIILKISNTTHEFKLTDIDHKIAAISKIKSKLKRIDAQQLIDIINELETNLIGDSKETIRNSLIYAPLNWSDINNMLSSQLISIGCHCRSHVILSKCSKDQTFEEIKSSKNRIEEKTGRKCDLFSYPNGKSDDFNIETVEILKFLNFSSAVTTIIGANNHKSDLYQLNRLPITGQGNIASFKRTLNPISRTLRKLKNSI